MANVLYGLKDTHSIKLINMIQHTLSVEKSIKKSLLVVDMPKELTKISRLQKKMQKQL